MPIHKYKCKKCEKEFEEFYKTQTERDMEEANVPCPQCGSVEKEKQINEGTSFQLKGRGWYKDGY